MKNLTKTIALFTCLLALSLSTQANDTIRMIKKLAGGHIFGIAATDGEQFTVDWGDGTAETFTGTGDTQVLYHLYSNDPGRYEVTISANSEDCLFPYLRCDRVDTLDLSACPSIEILSCGSTLSTLRSLNVKNCMNLRVILVYGQKLSYLDLLDNTVFQDLLCKENELTSIDLVTIEYISCGENRLPLSELYKISEMISDPYDKLLGRQVFLQRRLVVGDTVDFSSQKEFGGIATVFTVEKSGRLAPPSDYTVEDGVITFHKSGIYNVIMTNAAVVSHPLHGMARVIAPFEVMDSVGIHEPAQEVSKIEVHPNPTTGELTMNNEQLIINNVGVYDVYGRKQKIIINYQLSIINSIDILHLPAGIYFLKIRTEAGEVVKKVVKQ